MGKTPVVSTSSLRVRKEADVIVVRDVELSYPAGETAFFPRDFLGATGEVSTIARAPAKYVEWRLQLLATELALKRPGETRLDMNGKVWTPPQGELADGVRSVVRQTAALVRRFLQPDAQRFTDGEPVPWPAMEGAADGDVTAHAIILQMHVAQDGADESRAIRSLLDQRLAPAPSSIPVRINWTDDRWAEDHTRRGYLEALAVLLGFFVVYPTPVPDANVISWKVFLLFSTRGSGRWQILLSLSLCTCLRPLPLLALNR
jgi:hypothetical protein